MAARSPRRTFAAPFVVTLATIPACYVQSTPPPQPPSPAQPQPGQSTTTTTDAPAPAPVMVNPPRPAPPADPATGPVATTTPPTSAGPAKWRVTKPGDTCEAREVVSCPAGAICNPPPPFPYACPQNVTIDARGITIVAAPDGKTCSVEPPPVSCPPNVMCNPPRPQPAACPVRPR